MENSCWSGAWSMRGELLIHSPLSIIHFPLSSAEQRERHRIDARGLAVRLRRADGRAAVFLVHLHRRQLIFELEDLPFAVGGDERALLLRPFPHLLRDILRAYIRVFLDERRIDLPVRDAVCRAVAADIGVLPRQAEARR